MNPTPILPNGTRVAHASTEDLGTVLGYDPNEGIGIYYVVWDKHYPQWLETRHVQPHTPQENNMLDT